MHTSTTHLLRNILNCLQQAEVEIPAVGGRLARLHRAPGGGRERQGRGAGGRGEALLRARVGGVHAPGVDVDGLAAEGGDAIEQEQRPRLFRQPRDGLDGLAHARGGFGVDDGDEPRGALAQGALHVVGGDGGAPGGGHARHFRARARGHLGDALAKVAADADDGAVAGLEQVHDGRFHAAGAGAGGGEGDVVGGAEDAPHHRLALVHDAHEFGVEVAEDGEAHGGQHAGVGAAGAGAHERAAGRIERGNLRHARHATGWRG